MKSKIWTTCVLLCLFARLESCCGVSGSPITNDMSRLLLLKQNIPKDYQIPIHYIPKEMSGMCWVTLNIYPLEESLRDLAQMFGAISSNRDNIIIFITMLQSLRIQLDHKELEATMQIFHCHYREEKQLSGHYFDYVKELLNSAARGEIASRCKPPPCHAPNSHLSGSPFQDSGSARSRRSLFFLLLIPVSASVFLLAYVLRFRRGRPTQRALENGQTTPASEGERTTAVPVPLQTFPTTTTPPSVPT